MFRQHIHMHMPTCTTRRKIKTTMRGKKLIQNRGRQGKSSRQPVPSFEPNGYYFQQSFTQLSQNNNTNNAHGNLFVDLLLHSRKFVLLMQFFCAILTCFAFVLRSKCFIRRLVFSISVFFFLSSPVFSRLFALCSIWRMPKCIRAQCQKQLPPLLRPKKKRKG